ncbi:hypothetical protein FCM35_KLT19001 [Carex littledalei]|uniref:Uncharacterized protein n=1 Tax=Carex littledalei TaxID=544730 RepID=A0A833R0R5_9POAL|nr:hypothetical protein FCM35_KLT19001 [Carex littledalei]
MEEAGALYLMGNLMRAQYRAHRAIIRAGRARAPDQENMQLRHLGSSLAMMAKINAVVACYAFINPPAKNLADQIPMYMRMIISVVQGFTFVSGIIAMAIGWLLIVHDNPLQHRRLAKVILLLIQFASAFALGILLLACSSSIDLH